MQQHALGQIRCPSPARLLRPRQIVYNEKVSKKDDKTVVLQSGQELSADLVIWAVGAKPNTEFLKGTELAPALDGAGRVKVGLRHPWGEPCGFGAVPEADMCLVHARASLALHPPIK